MEIIEPRQVPNRLIRRLTDLERAAIIRHFGYATATEVESSLAIALLQQAKSLGAWIACDCRCDKTPFLYPRHLPNGVVTVVRPSSRHQVTHDKGCPFYYDSPEQIPQSEAPVTDPLLHRLFPLTTHGEGSISLIINDLANLHRQLHSQLTCYRMEQGKHPCFEDVVREARQRANEVVLAPDLDIRLTDFFTTSIKYRFRFFDELRQRPRLYSSASRQGYLLTLAKALNGQTVTCMNGDEVFVKGTVHRQEDMASDAYFALFLFAADERGWFEAHHVSLIGSYSFKLPWPIFNDDQRTLLKNTMAWRLYWQGKGREASLFRIAAYQEPSNTHLRVKDKISGRHIDLRLAIDPPENLGSTNNILVIDPRWQRDEFNRQLSQKLWGHH